MNVKISPTKLEVLKSEISSAVYLYFTKRDYISIHLLVSAAHDIADTLCRKSDKVGLSTANFLEKLPQQNQKLIADMFKANYNYFKHANWKSEKTPALPIKYTETLLLWVIYQYRAITKGWTWDMNAFVFCFAKKNPNVVQQADPGSKEYYEMVSNFDWNGLTDQEIYEFARKHFGK